MSVSGERTWVGQPRRGCADSQAAARECAKALKAYARALRQLKIADFGLARSYNDTAVALTKKVRARAG